MPKKQTETKPLRFAEINAHELLDDEQRKMCRIMSDRSHRSGESFTMLDFARISLRATGNTYAELKNDGDTAKQVMADREHQRAAVLFVYEALKACDIAIIKEWPEFDEMLKNLVYLANDLP